MKNIFVLFFLLLTSKIVSQSLSNMQLLTNAQFKENRFEQVYKPEYTFKNKKWYIKYNPVSLFFGGSLLFYQRKVSRQIAAQCGHEISCSNFSKQVIQRYGIFKGVFLTADRLTRCTKISFSDLNRNVDVNKKTGKIIDNPAQYKLKDTTSVH